MNQKQIAKQMIAFNKTAFDNNFSAMKALHEHRRRDAEPAQRIQDARERHGGP